MANVVNPFEELNLKLDTILSELRGKPKESNSLSDSEEFLTINEAAAFLKLSVSRVYTLISKKNKELPVIRKTKRCYFLKSDLVQYLKEGREMSSSEISCEADKYKSNKTGLNDGK